MTFLAPWWLAAAAMAGGAVVIMHLLARRRPRVLHFPTTRFVPERPTTSASLATRPTDLPLLLFRVLLILLLGAAFAQPVISRPGRTRKMVLVDQSRLAPALDSANARLVRAADVVLVFDTSARRIPSTDSALRLESGNARGSLSAALVAAMREASALAGMGDSLALTIISPFGQEEFDPATLEIRKRWKGEISLVRTAARVPAVNETTVALPPDDPLAAALALMDPDGTLPSRLVRGNADAEDSAWASAGGALVIWPTDPSPMGWPRGPGDSAGGVAADDQAVVAAFPREFAPPPGTLAAAWSDGSPAATVVAHGSGCIRNVAIPVPVTGDLVLRESFLRLTRSLVSACAGWIELDSAPTDMLDNLRGSPGLFSVAAAGNAERTTPANPWLLLTAALVFALEPLLRRSRAVQ